MKKLLPIMFTLASIVSLAQNKNFIISQNFITWKFIYEDSESILKLKNNLGLQFKTDSTGFIKRTNFNDRKLLKLEAEFKIEFKINRYRVSVYNIKFIEDPAVISNDSLLLQVINERTIEQKLLTRKGLIRGSSFGYNLTEILNPHFVKLFRINDDLDSNW
ncbi:hypothetical protein SAMN05444372_10980 [Flavobacterium micromati]|uniref:DUF4468 domain-containing protein n=1 Tax=Flavobacterium micromati TaxID=229205 RepID=A0A1M5M7X5_9FLAO|nr:hypothetical protein [Flavobacterium micromati]SHG73325.1 hypothetical protein SAMN05444372_10980 [Flavobacterium micromati]